jgi:hypothetical protein
MGAAKCIAFAFEEECDDLVGITGVNCLERDGSLIVLAS